MAGRIIGKATIALVVGTVAAIAGVAAIGFATGLKEAEKPTALDVITKERLK